MAAITSAMVKELRERTSAGMMDCKKALVESDGDMDKAIEWLREKGLSQAAKKASRTARPTSLPRPITSSASPTKWPSRLPWPTPLMWTP